VGVATSAQHRFLPPREQEPCEREFTAVDVHGPRTATDTEAPDIPPKCLRIEQLTVRMIARLTMWSVDTNDLAKNENLQICGQQLSSINNRKL
jgi:hypothetical protein